MDTLGGYPNLLFDGFLGHLCTQYRRRVVNTKSVSSVMHCTPYPHPSSVGHAPPFSQLVLLEPE